MWFQRVVQHGKKLGRTIGFPTLNLNVGSVSEHYQNGVYACTVHIDGEPYRGALHLGPKLGEPKPVLEIHVLNFDRMIYGKRVSFMMNDFIRPLRTFDSLDLLKKQIEDDLKKVL